MWTCPVNNQLVVDNFVGANLWNLSLIELKALREKEKMLVTSIFSCFHIVFKDFFLRVVWDCVVEGYINIYVGSSFPYLGHVLPVS